MAQQAHPKKWSRTKTRNVTDIVEYALGGTVREWTHDETGDTVSIYVNDEGHRSYGIKYNGEDIDGFGTLREAESSTVDTLRHNEDGL